MTTPSRIWWCAVQPGRDCRDFMSDYPTYAPQHADCGPGKIVPVDALVLVRDADGNWPHRTLFELALMISTETNPDAEVDTFPFYMEVAGKCLDEMEKRLAAAEEQKT